MSKVLRMGLFHFAPTGCSQSCYSLISLPHPLPPHSRLLVRFQLTLLSSECHALIFVCFTVDVEESSDLCVYVFNCRC